MKDHSDMEFSDTKETKRLDKEQLISHTESLTREFAHKATVRSRVAFKCTGHTYLHKVDGKGKKENNQERDPPKTA